MVYRVSPLTYALGRPRVKLTHFAMVNLIAQAEVVPELVQANFTTENVVRELNRIIADGPARERMLARLRGVVQALRSDSDDSWSPAERAAEHVLGFVARGAGHG
jgi:lipid-A-disaccharide synthase